MILIMLALFLVFQAAWLDAEVWNFAADFGTEPTINPNGAWTYGWKNVFDQGPFVPFDTKVPVGEDGPIVWLDHVLAGSSPYIWKNVGAEPKNGVLPSEVALVPGRRTDGATCVARWISPVEGKIVVQGSFGAGNRGSMNYAILVNGFSMGQRPSATTSQSITLLFDVTPGDLLDFEVSPGDGWADGDTALHLSIWREDVALRLPPLMWNLVAEFGNGPTMNPKGAWSYGWKKRGDPRLHRFDEMVIRDGNAVWYDTTQNTPSSPFIWKNLGGMALSNVYPRGLSLHPGASSSKGSIAVARWSPSMAGKFTIQGCFAAGAPGYMTYTIAFNEGTILYQFLDATSTGAFSFTLEVKNGDTLDFMVDQGTLESSEVDTPVQAVIWHEGCGAGHQLVNGICSACATGTWSAGGGTPCTPCSCPDCNALTGVCPVASSAQVWSFTRDYGVEPLYNPNTVWTCGWKMVLDQELFPFDVHADRDGNQAWYASTLDRGSAYIWKNIRTDSTNGIFPGEVSLHPGRGAAGSICAVRWISPFEGPISVQGCFGAGDVGRMSYAVLFDNKFLFQLDDRLTSETFGFELNVHLGDALDFLVYQGTEEWAHGDTPLQISIWQRNTIVIMPPATWMFVADYGIELVPNPNDRWSYGWKKVPEQRSLTLFDVHEMKDGNMVWYDRNMGGSSPHMWKSLHTEPMNNILPGQITLHPGEHKEDGSVAVARWTSSLAGSFVVQGYFGAGDSGPMELEKQPPFRGGAMNYAIAYNGVVVWARFNVFTTETFSLRFDVKKDDTLDFTVNQGLKGWYYGNTPVAISLYEEVVPCTTGNTVDMLANDAQRKVGTFAIALATDTVMVTFDPSSRCKLQQFWVWVTPDGVLLRKESKSLKLDKSGNPSMPHLPHSGKSGNKDVATIAAPVKVDCSDSSRSFVMYVAIWAKVKDASSKEHATGLLTTTLTMYCNCPSGLRGASAEHRRLAQNLPEVVQVGRNQSWAGAFVLLGWIALLVGLASLTMGITLLLIRCHYISPRVRTEVMPFEAAIALPLEAFEPKDLADPLLRADIPWPCPHE